MGMVIYLRRASLADVQRVRADPQNVDSFVFEEGHEEVDLVDFDKAWHALHFMLTGQSYGLGHPLGIIADETAQEGIDADGLGGFAVVDPARMAIFNAASEQISDDELKARCNPQAMIDADIYIADVLAEDDTDEMIEYVMQGVPSLRRFARSCAANGDGALRFIA